MGTAKRERQKANRQARLEELQRQARKTKAKRVGMRWGIGIPVALALLFGLVWLLKDDESSTTTSPTNPSAGTAPAGDTVCPKADGSSARQTVFNTMMPMCIDPAHSYTATFDTTEGTFEIALDTVNRPATVNNFVGLARYHFYDDTKIFRADSSIDIIQGGGASPSSQFSYTIPDEGSGFTYQAGDFVMARTSEPNSAGAQWFIAGGPKVSALDSQGTYVKFGKVTKGLEIVTRMVGFADPQNPMGISKDITIKTVTIAESDTASTVFTKESTPPGTAAAGSTPSTNPPGSTPGTSAAGTPAANPPGASTPPGTTGS